jgi:hypothetical protein
MFRSFTRAANLDKGIRSTEFQTSKERMLILYFLLEKFPGLDADQIQAFGDAVLFVGVKQNTLALLNSFSKEEKGGWFSWGKGKTAVTSKEEEMWRIANDYAASVSDLDFLSFIQTIPTGDFLYVAAAECEETAYDYLTTQLNSLVTGICGKVFSIQEEELDRHVQREIKSEEDKELKLSRAEFVQKIEYLCRERSRSYVTYSSQEKQ